MSAESNAENRLLHELLDRALREQDFAERLLDPERQAAALDEMHIKVTPEVLHEVNHAADHLRNLYETFGAGPRPMAS
jgi:hypothetical protein